MPIAPVTIQHHLLFHYYAGCILAAVQRFKEACAYFETVGFQISFYKRLG